MNSLSVAKRLLTEFLSEATRYNGGMLPNKVAITNTFSIGIANVLVRTASDLGKRYFFGLNYLNAEEIINMENAFIAFICGDIQHVVFIPASKIAELIPQFSHDRNGEFKINFTRDYQMVLNGQNNRFDSRHFINNWSLLNDRNLLKAAVGNPLDTIHSLIQGRLIELGRLKGWDTFCPNKSWTFNGKAG
jgi:hypothetical protein